MPRQVLPPDPTPVQVYADLWLARNGPDWVDVTQEMLVDTEGTLGLMTRALARAGLLEHHFVSTEMKYKAKLKQE